MTELRIRGQEAVIRLARGNEVEATLTAISDFTWQYDFATLEEGYIGETTVRKDDIFNGISGSFTIHQEGQELLLFLEFLKRRAQRKANTPVNSNRVNATVRLTFPNGQTPRVLIPDMKFGAAPNAIPGRDAYINTAFTYMAEDTRVIET